MKRFEYKMVRQDALVQRTVEDIELELNYEGANGWELCGIDWRCLIFKREIPQE